MGFLNVVVVEGIVATDPEYKEFGKSAVCNFRLAIPRRWSGKDGSERKSDFVTVTAWGKDAETITNTISKGDKFRVACGRLEIQEYTTKDGKKVSNPQIVIASGQWDKFSSKAADDSKSTSTDTNEVEDSNESSDEEEQFDPFKEE